MQSGSSLILTSAPTDETWSSGILDVTTLDGSLPSVRAVRTEGRCGADRRAELPRRRGASVHDRRGGGGCGEPPAGADRSPREAVSFTALKPSDVVCAVGAVFNIAKPTASNAAGPTGMLKFMGGSGTPQKRARRGVASPAAKELGPPGVIPIVAVTSIW